jgi:flagellin
VYSGARTDYVIYVNTGTTGSPTWTVYDEANPQTGNGEFKVEHLAGGADGTDIMTRVEALEFSDTQLSLATGSLNNSFTTALTAGSPAGQPSTGGSGFVGGGSSGGSVSGSSGSSGAGLVSPHGAEGISSLANVSPESAIDIIDRAIQTISDERAKLGAIINSLMHHQRWSLQQAESTSAAQSRILDANYAFEAAQLAKAQILQQAGVAMLTQTNMQPRQALNLLQ